ncbi:metal ABC transporter solute-binding protein, Zn/Mn family [Roseateles sp. GG27B]
MAQHRTIVFSRRRLALLGACGLASATLPAWAVPAVATASVATAPPEPLRVVASFSILADMVREVGGPAVAVTALVGPDADAHVYTPSPADVKRVAGAQLLVFNGLGFEGWLQRLVKASGYRGTVLLASQGVKPRQQVEQGGHDHGSQDPHAWQNLSHGQQYVENIRAALVQALPAQAAVITQRARDYQAQLQALDTELRSGLAAVPQTQRRVITTHDAFAYLGANYGIGSGCAGLEQRQRAGPAMWPS